MELQDVASQAVPLCLCCILEVEELARTVAAEVKATKVDGGSMWVSSGMMTLFGSHRMK